MPDPATDLLNGIPDAQVKKKYNLSDDDLFTLHKYNYATTDGGLTSNKALEMYPGISKYITAKQQAPSPDPIGDIKAGVPDATLKKKYNLSDDDIFTLKKYSYATTKGGLSTDDALELYPDVSKFITQKDTPKPASSAKPKPSVLPDVQFNKPSSESTRTVQSQQSLKQFQNKATQGQATDYANKQARDQEIADQTTELTNKQQPAITQLSEVDARRSKVNATNQAETDRFYDTPGGKAYYNFLKPFWKATTEGGGKILGATVRLAGDIGGLAGAPGAKETADKLSDGIVDYFDFDRRATEQRGDSNLYNTPTKLQGNLINNGKISGAKLIPSTVENLTNMAMLLGGGEAIGGGKAALFASSYFNTVEQYRKDAEAAGLKGGQLDAFSNIAAGLTSVLEEISPNKDIVGQMKPALFKDAMKDINSGVTVATAIKRASKELIKENGKEFAQELSQNIGDHVVKAASDAVTDKPHFNEEYTPAKMFDEFTNTALMTFLPTTLLMAPNMIHHYSPSGQVKSSMFYAAQHLPEFTRNVDAAVANGKYTPDQGEVMKDNIGKYSTILGDTKKTGVSDDQAMNIAWSAYKAGKIDDATRSIQNNPILKETLGKEIEKTKEGLRNDIKDAAIGIPAVGAEVSGKEMKTIVSRTPNTTPEMLDKVEGGTYKVDEINLADKYNNDPVFKQSVDEFQKTKEDPEGLRMPAIVDATGNVVDGNKRLAQQYINGEKTARVFKEMQPEESSEMPKRDNAKEQLQTAQSALNPADPAVIEADNHVTEHLNKGTLPVTDEHLNQLADEAHKEIIHGGQTTNPEENTIQQTTDTGDNVEPATGTTAGLHTADVSENGSGVVHEEGEGIDFNEPLTNKEKAKSIADKMRAFAAKVEVSPDAAFSRPDVIPRAMLASGIRLAAHAVEAGGAIADGIKAAVTHIKSLLPDMDENHIREHVVNHLVDAGVTEAKTRVTKSGINESVSTKVKDKVIENEMSALKRQIKEKYKNLAVGEAEGTKKGKVEGFVKGMISGFKKGMREGSDIATKAQKAFDEHVTELKDKISSMLKDAEERGVFTSETKGSMVKSIAKALNNARSPVALLRAMEHVDKIINNVEYDKNLNEANALKINVAKVIKGKSLERSASNVETVKAFLKINPKDVTDLQEYKDMAAKVLATSKAMSVKIDEGKATVRNATHEIDNAAIKEYTDKELAHAEDLAKQRISDSYNDLVDLGVIDPKSMSLKEMKDIVDAVNEGGESVDEKLDRLKAEGAEKKKALSDMVDYQKMGLEDHYSHIKDAGILTDQEHGLIKNLLTIDTKDLSVKQLVRLNDLINNIVSNNEFYGAGELAAISEVQRDNQIIEAKEKESGVKLSTVKSGLIKAFASVQLLHEFIFKNTKLAAEVQRLSGIYDIYSANARATKINEQAINTYEQLKKSIGGKTVDDAENRFTRGIYSQVIQDLAGTAEENQAEFTRRKKLIHDTYTKLLSSEFKQEQNEGKVVQKVYDNILADASSVKEAEAKVSDVNKRLVKYWQDTWADHSDRVEASSEIYNNKLFESYNNYTATKTKAFNGGQITKETGDIFEQNFISKKLDASPAKTKLSRTKGPSIGKNLVYDLDFDAVQAKRFHETMYDVESAPAIAKVKAFFDTPKSTELLGGVRNRNIVADAVRESVISQKQKPVPVKGWEKELVKVSGSLQRIGARLAIGSLSQLPKQYISVAASTLINLGGDMPLFFNALGVSNKLELFNQSSIGTRGETKAGYNRDTDVASIDRTKFGNTFQGMTESVVKMGEKITDKVMTPLVSSDVSVARTSWLAYYMQDLKKQGVDIKNIDWAKAHETFNKEAGAYAEQMISRSQNPNNNSELATFYRSKGAAEILKNVFLPFNSFAVNGRVRITNDVQKLLLGGEKAEAFRSLSATVAEQALFNAIKVYILAPITTWGAREIASLFGFWDDDDEKKAHLHDQVDIHTGIGTVSMSDKTKKWLASTASDLLFSGLGNGTQQGLQMGLNSFFSANATETYPNGAKPNDHPTLFYSPDTKTGGIDFTNAGMFGIPLEAIKNLAKTAPEAITGRTELVTKGGNASVKESHKVDLTQEERSLFMASFLVNAFALAGASDAEVTNMNRKLQAIMAKEMKKRYGGESTFTIYSKGKGEKQQQ